MASIAPRAPAAWLGYGPAINRLSLVTLQTAMVLVFLLVQTAVLAELFRNRSGQQLISLIY